MSDVVLTANQYGKAENRVVRVTRDTDRHEIEDLNVTSQLRGDFDAAHTEGDNAHVVATDTQKNTIFAFARDGVGSPEAFLLRLADHFTGDFDWVTGGRWAAEQYGWTRINDHDHSFYRARPEIRTAVLVRDGDTDTMIAGFHGLTVLKSTESGFVGYPKDKYTTLAETTDRILATDIATRWRYNTTDVDFNAVYDDIKADHPRRRSPQEYSNALQQTLYQMAEAVIDGSPRGRRDQVLHEAVLREVGDRADAGAEEFREIAVVVIAAPGFIGMIDGIADQCSEASELAGECREAADAERIEPPQRIHQRQRDETRPDHRPAQVRENRKQEGDRVAVDHHQVDEVHGHLHDVVLEPRQQHQHHDHGQRQRARERGPPQQRDPEAVEDAPATRTRDASRNRSRSRTSGQCPQDAAPRPRANARYRARQRSPERRWRRKDLDSARTPSTTRNSWSAR